MDPFGQSLLGSEPVEQRDELPALGGLEAATELLLMLNGDLHDCAEQPPALLCEVQGPHATIAGAELGTLRDETRRWGRAGQDGEVQSGCLSAYATS